MSSISRWSYKNTARVKPFRDYDQNTGQAIYGEEYTIACTWTAESKVEIDRGGQSGAMGQEFVSQHIIYTEDDRPVYMDMIALAGSDDFEQIRSVTGWDMNMFSDSMDFKLVT